MTESAPMSGGPGVALLFEDATLSAHLREALIEAGARIVHEGPATKATREDLSGNGAEVVVVNLDEKVEDYLDALYDIFDEDRQRVVFNDAEASSGLSGWDQARWARHLAAKLMDGHDVDPPRPEEARPVEAHPTELMLPEDEMPEAPPEEELPSLDLGSMGGDDASGGEADLTAELEALLAEDDELLGRAEDQAAREMEAPSIELELGEVDFDSGELDDIPDAEPVATEPGLDMAAPDTAQVASAADTGDVGDDEFEQTLRMFDQALAEQGGTDDGDSHADAEALFQADADASGPEQPAAEPEPEQASAPAPAASALSLEEPQADAAPAAKPEPSISVDAGNAFSLVDPDDDSPADPTANQKKADAPDAPDWDFVDFDADDAPAGSSGKLEIMQQGKGVEAVDPSEFGIEKMSANEYLSPEDEDNAGDPGIEPGMSLELEPIAQAVAPKMAEGSEQGSPFGANLEGDIRHTVVIAAGSSMEARDSLREFLAAVNRVPDAVVIGVVHQQPGDDLAALASELNAASPILPVRVAPAESQARHGEMVLVPPGKQAALQVNGKLQLLDCAAQPSANPSIDLSMSTLARELGENVLAIILAGEAIDAVAGAQAVSDSGGTVWAMDPSDCTDNTMVTVVCEEQLAQYTGTPQELAARMLEDMS